MTERERIVPVVIQGQRYPVRSALDPEYVAQLAAYVDQKMHAAAEKGSVNDTLRLAVLAALNLADEVFRCRQASAMQNRELTERTGALEELLDHVLGLPQS